MKWKWLTHHFVAKVACLAAATLLWLYIAGEQIRQKTLLMPVRVALPPDLTAVKILPHRVSVTLSGPEKDFETLPGADVGVDLDLRNYDKPVALQFSILPQHVTVPGGLSIENIEPAQVEIVLDRVIVKDLAVQPMFSGAPMDGFQITGNSASPSRISCQGPESILEKMTVVNTLPVDLTGRSHSFVQSVPVLSLFMGDKAAPPRMVDVSVTLEEQFTTRTFEKVPVRYQAPSGLRKKISLKPDLVSVELEGNPVVLKNLDPQKIMLAVSIEKLEDGSYRLPILCWVPEKVRVVGLQPSETEVVVESP